VEAEEPAAAHFFVPPPDDAPVLRRRRRQWHAWVRVVAVLLAIAVVGALIAGGIVISERMRHGQPVEVLGHKLLQGTGAGEGPPPIELPPVAAFTPPSTAWKPDPRAGNEFNATLGMRRDNPPAFLAIFLKSYKDRNPRDAKLVEEALHLLQKKFKAGVEFQPDAPDHLGEAQVQHLSFQGEVNGDFYSGECSMVAHKGIGVWLFTWTPGTIDQREKSPTLKAELADAYKGLALKDRPGWKGDHPVRHIFPGRKVTYSLEDTDGVWQRKRAEDFDVDADLALQAFDRESPLAIKTAEVLVFVLPAPADGRVVEVAQAWLEKYHKKDYEQSVSERVPTKSGERVWSDHVGAAEGKVLKYHVRNTETRERLVVVGIVPRGERYILIHGECDWRFRDLWETDFVQLLNSFKLKTAE
jgi:hypothetical protein